MRTLERLLLAALSTAACALVAMITLLGSASLDFPRDTIPPYDPTPSIHPTARPIPQKIDG
jgi:hypothetical protein